MHVVSSYQKYWGKSDRTDPARYHPLFLHGLDTSAFAWALLESDDLLLKRFQRLLGLPLKAIPPLLSFLAGLHDLGKFSPRFQALRPELLKSLQGREYRGGYLPHTQLGREAWRRLIIPTWREEDWFGLTQLSLDFQDLLDCLMIWRDPVTAHHGQPVEGLGLPLDALFEKQDQVALVAYARELAALLGGRGALLVKPEPDLAWDDLRAASWLLAGLIVLCDWLASNEGYFPFHSQPTALADYWPKTLEQARQALKLCGLAPARPAPFTGIAQLFGNIDRPRPMQRFAAETALSPGPGLFILEDATGSGKTEAALILAQRLLAGQEAGGLFIGLPTMATANAMHRRLEQVYRRFFAADAQPSLVLAHSQKRLADGLARLQKVGGASSAEEAGGGGRESSVREAAAWLADSNKKSLLANVGVGTLDQALLAALPVRHQALRLLGLCRSLLIVDEVHAYDAYTTELLAGLLRFLAALGGSAILLSATLPLNTRRQLVAAFAQGLGRSAVGSPSSLDYPLASCLTAERFTETAAPLAEGSSRALRVELIGEDAVVGEHLVAAAEAGGCACWIRNTVNDAIRAYRELAERLGPERVELFHARFAMGDRLAIEDRVLNRFGPKSTPEDRAGRILVATQVVEQSLDLDFDLLATDLAPMDLLIQRAGRLHRHQRPDRPLHQPRLLVLSPSPVAEAPRDWHRAFAPQAARVYRRPGQLWLTASRLAASPTLVLPDRARELVEGVFGDQAAERVPVALRDIEEAEEGRECAERSLGRLHCLVPEQGYGWGDVPWQEDTPTRLGPPSVILRLARWEAGRLRPWAEGDDMLAWELSQVRVWIGQVADEVPDPGEALTEALGQAKAAMPDLCRHALLVALEPGPDGSWRGRAVDNKGESVRIDYHMTTGVELI